MLPQWRKTLSFETERSSRSQQPFLEVTEPLPRYGGRRFATNRRAATPNDRRTVLVMLLQDRRAAT
jgi:hypothetical protein